MTKLPEYRCPVCRATRPGQDQCRRCQADLRLVQRCWETSTRLWDRCQAIDPSTNSAERAALERRLEVLAPKFLKLDQTDRSDQTDQSIGGGSGMGLVERF